MKKAIAFIKRFKATLLIGAIAIIVAQCSSTKSTTVKVDPFQPQQTDVAIADAHWQGTSLDQLKQGYGVYSTACTSCHDMKAIKDFSLADWPDLIDKMSRKAKLDSTKYKLVYHYVMTRREALGN